MKLSKGVNEGLKEGNWVRGWGIFNIQYIYKKKLKCILKLLKNKRPIFSIKTSTKRKHREKNKVKKLILMRKKQEKNA